MAIFSAFSAYRTALFKPDASDHNYFQQLIRNGDYMLAHIA
jgi:hypothetical protein